MLCAMNGNKAGGLGIEQLESRTLLSVGALPMRIGAAGFDMGKRIAVTPDGGYVTAGIFSGTVRLPSKLVELSNRGVITVAGDTDLYVAKYTSAGYLQWVKQFGGSDIDEGINDADTIDIAADPARAGGQFINGFGSDPVNAGEYIEALKVAPDGSIYFAGNFTGSIDFNPGPGKNVLTTFDTDYYDGFVAKLQPNGGLHWARQIGGRFTDTVNALTLDASGNVLVTGLFSRTVSFKAGDPRFTLNALGRADGYVLKFDSAGQVQWVNQFGADAIKKPERDAGNDVAVDSAGNVYVVGTVVGDVDFNPDPQAVSLLHTSKRTDGFLAKYDANGRFRSVAGVGGEDYDGLTHVAVDSRNDIILTGYFQGDQFDAVPGVGFYPYLSATPKEPGDDPKFTDAYVQKLSRGRVAWTQQVYGTGTEFIDDLKLDSADNILVCGSFYGMAKFGQGTSFVTSIRGAEAGFDDSNDSDREYSYDAFAWKLEPNAGFTQWVKSIGAAGDDFGAGIDIASGNSILFTGRFRGTTDFDTTRGQRRLTGQYFDAFVTGFDANGRPLF